MGPTPTPPGGDFATSEGHEPREPLAGHKTYLVAAALLLYAASGAFLGYVEPAHGIEIALEAAALIAVRMGIAKAEFLEDDDPDEPN